MVYLMRTADIIGDWNKTSALVIKLIDYMEKNFSEIQEVKLLSNINGRQNQIHWVLTFKSLADEEKFSTKSSQDPDYIDLIMGTQGLLGNIQDNFYRSFVHHS
jgi:hypothetical protein